MEFVRHNQKLISIVSVATIILVVIFNILYFIFAPIQSQGDPESFITTPIIEGRNQATSSGALTVDQSRSPISTISLSILLVIALLMIIIVLALVKYKNSQRHQRDRKRKDDLKRLAQAFEAYRQEHGQYPLSSTYQPQYYTGINLSNDWNYYGLPDKDHMVRYLPDWPISDPSLNYNAKNQINQYIYYPKENGQKFFLYAHLEAPSKEEQIDYNQQDNLLRSWGNYNYRVSSGQQQPSNVQQIPHPTHAKAQESNVVGPTTMPATPSTPPVNSSTQSPTAAHQSASSATPTTSLPNPQPAPSPAELASSTSAPSNLMTATASQPNTTPPSPNPEAAEAPASMGPTSSPLPNAPAPIPTATGEAGTTTLAGPSQSSADPNPTPDHNQSAQS